MPHLPFELILDIAAFCAGSFNFKTFLNIALTCRQATKSFQSVLARPILVLSNLEVEDGSIKTLNGERIAYGTVPEKWRNVQ